ncbi:hypothetical protein [Microbacterium suwonense]|uniref:hypothetical protein n=1 Tax=Microbacterium suwonense TaxID=683047 RepID=UPI002573C56B|nr:hypothetical protein [Microbacterium suwonense]
MRIVAVILGLPCSGAGDRDQTSVRGTDLHGRRETVGRACGQGRAGGERDSACERARILVGDDRAGCRVRGGKRGGIRRSCGTLRGDRGPAHCSESGR